MPQVTRSPLKKCDGFTAIEALVSVAIVGLLASLALPSFIDTIERYRVSTVVDELSSAVNLTRNAAIQRNGNVVFAKLAGTECPTTQQWSCGWEIFQDFNNNDTRDAGDPREDAIFEYRITTGVEVNRSTNGATMRANRWGQLNGNGTAGFTLIPKGKTVSAPSTTTVCINSGGRVRVVTGSVTC